MRCAATELALNVGLSRRESFVRAPPRIGNAERAWLDRDETCRDGDDGGYDLARHGIPHASPKRLRSPLHP
jgi:hypothetical protein